jgi:hypothetical protein
VKGPPFVFFSFFFFLFSFFLAGTIDTNNIFGYGFERGGVQAFLNLVATRLSTRILSYKFFS